MAARECHKGRDRPKTDDQDKQETPLNVADEV